MTCLEEEVLRWDSTKMVASVLFFFQILRVC